MKSEEGKQMEKQREKYRKERTGRKEIKEKMYIREKGRKER